jgi:hypothetical protein
MNPAFFRSYVPLSFVVSAFALTLARPTHAQGESPTPETPPPAPSSSPPMTPPTPVYLDKPIHTGIGGTFVGGVGGVLGTPSATEALSLSLTLTWPRVGLDVGLAAQTSSATLPTAPATALTSMLAIYAGPRVYTSTTTSPTAIVPFVGVGLSAQNVTYAQSSVGSVASGWTPGAYVSFGVTALRTTLIGLELGFRVDIPFAETNTGDGKQYAFASSFLAGVTFH